MVNTAWFLKVVPMSVFLGLIHVPYRYLSPVGIEDLSISHAVCGQQAAAGMFV